MKNLDISKLKVDYNKYSDALMIHLQPNDYIVYIPSVNENEEIIRAGNFVGVGFIFYYKGKLNLSDYELTYKNALKLQDDSLFNVVCFLGIVWITAFVIFMYIKNTIKKMRAEMTSQIRNMSIMADMYLEVYLIDVEEDSAVVIREDPDKSRFNLEGKHVQEKINNKICDNCNEVYQAELMQFLDIKSVKKRMNGASSITYEWVDEEIGWCAIRLFCIGEDKTQIVFALQNINEEKRKMNAAEERIRMAEFNQVVNGSFIETVAGALNEIATSINQTGMAIQGKATNEEEAMLSDVVISGSKHLILVQNTLFDMYALESKRFMLNSEVYNVHEMMDELTHLVSPFVARDKYEFIVDVDKEIPNALIGDKKRLEQILMILMLSSLMVTQNGTVKLTVYGKNHGDEEELIFSNRDTAMGFSVEQLKEINAFISGSRIESFDNASLVYLKIINGILGYMNSELKVVSVQGEGSEFYFSIKQKIAQ